MIQRALQWLLENLYNYMVPICILCVLRIVVSFLELGHVRRLREKKFVYRKVGGQYREIGAFTGLLIGSVLICLLPRLGLLLAVVAAGLTVLGYQLGKRKGEAADRFWQEVVNDLATSKDGDKVNALPVESTFHGLIDTLDVYDEPAETGAAHDTANGDTTENEGENDHG